MFRIDAVFDRISFQQSERADTLNEYSDLTEKLHEVSVINALKNNENRKKLITSLSSNDHDNIEILRIVMKIITENYERERINYEVAVATNLMAILLRLIESTPAIWIKFSEIISNNKHEKVRETFDQLLSKHQIVVMKILEITRKYFDTICEFNGEFFIDTNCELINKKFHTLKLQQVVLVVHQMLSNKDVAGFVSQKIFDDFELSPSFVCYLKSSLNNLSM